MCAGCGTQHPPWPQANTTPHHRREFDSEASDASNTLCDYSDGQLTYDSTIRSPRYDNTCKEIYKGWNCISSNKANALDIVKWRRKPNHCDLPQFEPLRFLEKYRDISIGFVGDSLNRNMFVALFCTLKRVPGDVRKWRPAGADRGLTFSPVQPYYCLSSHKSFANPNGGILESLGYKEGYRVDVDTPEGPWVEAASFHDILIFNTGHWWWAPSKFDPVKLPMLFFEKGCPVVPTIPPDAGLDMVLKHMGEELFSLTNNGTYVEARHVNQHLYMALHGSGFHTLE
ncbi:unnamed protein product [Ilex paraguariensis]|uniref:Trichome birefringence-like N-terminal domain-containing protein n=1 Tax=Ilex paraguariensis TaxID=185542 RepID=A0ABC8SLT1_9AQUA